MPQSSDGTPSRDSTRTGDRLLRKQAIDWMLRLEDAPEDTALRARFDAWLAADPQRAIVYQRASRALGDASHLLSNDLDFARRAAHKRIVRPRTMLAVLAVLGAAAGAFYLADGPMKLRADVIAGVGTPRSVTLSDGSRIELNANSALAIAMRPGERHITLLRGEAYFQVAADPARPFVVEAGRGTTTALGTAFDIDLDDQGTRVTVTEHAVTVGSGSAAGSRRVSEAQQISYDTAGRLGDIRPADIAMATAWRQGRLVFDDRPLASVVADIERYVPGRIVIAQAALAERRISGSLDLTAPQAALAGFADATGIKVTRIGPYLTILRQ